MAGKALSTVLMVAVFTAGTLGVSGEPADLESVMARADSLAGEGMHLEAARLCEGAFDVVAPGRYDLFRVAEYFALAGETARSAEYLEKALDAGFINADLMLRYSGALEPVRSSDGWGPLEKRLRGNIDAARAAMPPEHEPLGMIDLPEPSLDGDISIEKVLRERRSVRSFADEAVTLSDCSQLLWAAYGITYEREGMPDFVRGGLRTAPSAGARYPLEIYLVAWKVEGLEAGIYHYTSETHRIDLLSAGDFRGALARACWDQGWIEEAAAAIVYSAVFERTTTKYGQRGRERYVCMDLGHSGENVYLQCGSLGLGTCAVGAFVDLELKQLIGMTMEEEPLYVMPFGRPAG